VTELPSWDTLTGWAAAGQAQVERAAGGLDPARLAGPSRLPGWTRGHVLSHLARNADALVNLLTWARTGAEARMYASPAERTDGIEAGAGRALPEQLADLTAAGAVVTGRPQRIAGWLTGRSGGDGLAVTGGELPGLPRWL
jgi:maleylpyruvate isomerase